MNRLFFNGRILTMEGNSPTYVDAVLVKDGIIAGTGSLEEMKALCNSAGEEETRMQDLQGCCLMPSFIDGHSHFVQSGQMATGADLTNTNSFEDIVAELRDFLAGNGGEKVPAIMGFGYDHNFLAEGRHPDKTLLDQVSRDIPIVLLHVSMHMGCANSKALELAGITENTPDPEGGKIYRVGDTMEPSGFCVEAGMYPLHYMMGRYNQGTPVVMMQKMQENYLKNGVTTVQDGATTQLEMNMLSNMGQSGALKVDVVAYPLLGEEAFTAESPERWNGYVNHVKFGGYKIILDGSPQGRTAWMSEPYEGSDECGFPAMQDDAVLAACERAIADGRQLLAHCNGDMASQQFLDAYEAAMKKGNGGSELRPMMIHCQTVREDQLDRMAAIGMIPSSFVGHVYYWGDIHLQNFGPVRGSRVSPVRSMLDKGLHVNFHQDTPVTAPNMLLSVWAAVNRMSRKGQQVGMEQAITVYEALECATKGGAYAYSEEDRKGTITPGKRADLVVLSACPPDVDPMNIKDIRVLETIKDGVTVYQA